MLILNNRALVGNLEDRFSPVCTHLIVDATSGTGEEEQGDKDDDDEDEEGDDAAQITTQEADVTHPTVSPR